MTITKELVIALFSIFPFLETTCTQVADETQSEAEIVEEIVNDPYTPNNIDAPVWTAEIPGIFEEDPENPDSPEGPSEFDQGRRDRFEDAKEIEEANGGSPWTNGPKLERTPHENIGLPNLPSYDTGPMGFPIPFGPGGALNPTPILFPPMPGVPGGGYNVIPVTPERYEEMYWENMYDPYTDSRGVQLLEANNYGYPVRIPGTSVDVPTPDQFAMLYYHWQYYGEYDTRWTHPAPPSS